MSARYGVGKVSRCFASEHRFFAVVLRRKRSTLSTATMRLSRADLFDRFHRAGVVSMLALTGFGAFLLTVRTYRYFTYVRPMQAERKRLLAEEMIEQEQIEKEAELMRRQKEAEKLVS